MPPAIGIDLGTTNSCVAVMQAGSPKVVPIQDGKFTLPSVVCFAGDQPIVGSAAKRQSVKDATKTVFAAKRLLGASFGDPHTQTAIANLPYRIVEGAAGDVRIQIGSKIYAVQEIGALILAEIKRAVELHLGERIEEAVVTVPAYFNDRQRQATKEAGKIAGLNVLQVVNEPTAAALAYGYHQGAERKIAVYDLGGGTFDVSVLNAGGGAVEVLATAGDDFLGGHDFDDRILGWLREQIEAKHGVTIKRENNSLQRLREAAESAKIRLTDEPSVKIALPFLATDTKEETINIDIDIDRKTFRTLVQDLVDRTIKVFVETIQAAGLRPDQIDELLVIGGMTNSPVVRDEVQRVVGREPASGVHPDLVVAVGAAYQADLIKTDETAGVLLDVISHNLGILSVAGISETVVPKNTKLPVQVTRRFSTVRDDQPSVRIVVFQGHSRQIDKNQILGEFFLEDIRLAPRGDVQIDVLFSVSADGIVTVRATDVETGQGQSIRVSGPTSLDDGEIERMIAHHQQNLPAPVD